MKPRIADAMLHLEREPGLEDEDLVAAIEKGIGEMRSEEAAATGDQNLHRAFPKSSPLRHPPRRAHSAAGRSASPSTWTRSRRSAPDPGSRRTPPARRRPRPLPLGERRGASAGRAHQTNRRRPALPRERAGIGMRHGAHQVVDPSRRPAPVDLAVVGRAPAEVARLRVILRDARRAPRRQSSGYVSRISCRRRLGGLAVQVERRVVVADRDPPLGDDVAAVRLLHHVVKRHAGLGLAVDEHPVDRRAAAKLRQQRAVQVERAARRAIEQLALAASDGTSPRTGSRGRSRARARPRRGVVDVGGRDDRDAVRARRETAPSETRSPRPGRSSWVITSATLVPAGEQLLETDRTDVVVGEAVRCARFGFGRVPIRMRRRIDSITIERPAAHLVVDAGRRTRRPRRSPRTARRRTGRGSRTA